MKCPSCGLLNPGTALRCDCGFDFSTKTLKSSYIGQAEDFSGNRQTPGKNFLSRYGGAFGVGAVLVVVLFGASELFSGFAYLFMPGLYLATLLVPEGAHSDFVPLWVAVMVIVNVLLYGSVVALLLDRWKKWMSAKQLDRRDDTISP